MGKYSSIIDDVFSVFASSSWVSENITTIPANFVPVTSGEEFIKVAILPSSQSVNIRSVSGQLLIDIFTFAGKGPSRYAAIADILDNYLSGKSLTTSSEGVSQFFESALSGSRQDEDNPSLSRVTYSISFNYFRS